MKSTEEAQILESTRSQSKQSYLLLRPEWPPATWPNVTTVSFKKIEYCLQHGFILQHHLILRDLSSLSTSNFKIKVLFHDTHSPSLPNMQVPLPF
jgi:hypothetical protein